MKPILLIFTLLIAAVSAQAFDRLAMLCAVNTMRAAANLTALGDDPSLCAAADQQANNQASMGTISHVGPDGSTPDMRIAAAGYMGTSAENVAVGANDIASIMTMWQNSPDHYANIMSSTSTQMCCSAATGADGQTYFVQTFGGNGNAGPYEACPAAAPVVPVAAPVAAPAAVAEAAPAPVPVAVAQIVPGTVAVAEGALTIG